MNLFHYSGWYENWAPLVGRILFGGLFIFGAMWKIPGTESFNMEVAMTAAKGIPFANIAVILAGIFELVLGLALIVGYHTRTAAMILGLMTIAFTAIFHFNFSDPMQIGQFVSHLGLIAGLLYISVYGAKSYAISKD